MRAQASYLNYAGGLLPPEESDHCLALVDISIASARETRFIAGRFDPFIPTASSAFGGITPTASTAFGGKHGGGSG